MVHSSFLYIYSWEGRDISQTFSKTRKLLTIGAACTPHKPTAMTGLRGVGEQAATTTSEFEVLDPELSIPTFAWWLQKYVVPRRCVGLIFVAS
jgi:hypothetical protein